MADGVIDFSSVDAGAQATDTQADQATEQQSSEQSSQQTQDGQQSQESGRQADAQPKTTQQAKDYRRVAREIGQSNPERAAELNEMADAFYRSRDYQAVFPKPKDAIAAKQLIESIGGVQGATELQQRIASYDAQDAGLKEGDPAVLEAMFKDFPKGAAALAPHYLAKLPPEARDAAVAPYAIDMLVQAGVEGHLNVILNETDPAKAKSLVTELAQWLAGQKSSATSLRNGNGKTGNQPDKLSEREQQLNQREEGLLVQSINSAAVPKIDTEITANCEKISRQYKLTDAQKATFGKFLSQRMGEILGADQSYMDQVKLYKKTYKSNPGKIADYIAGEYKSRMNDAAAELAKELYGAPKAGSSAGNGVTKPGQAATAPGGGPWLVAAQPPDAEIDWDRPNSEEAQLNFIRGRGWTKSGRFVTWRKQSA